MDQQQENRSMSISESVNLVVAAANVWATSITTFMRRCTGRDIPGFTGLCILVWIPIYFVITEEPAILLLWPAYLLAQLCHRVGQLRRFMRGVVMHSYYTGWPWLAMLVGARSEKQAKLVIEPMLSMLFGFTLAFWHPYAGLYFVAGAVAMLIVSAAMEERDQRQVQDMQNGMIEGGLLKSRSNPRERRFANGRTAG